MSGSREQDSFFVERFTGIQVSRRAVMRSCAVYGLLGWRLLQYSSSSCPHQPGKMQPDSPSRTG